MTTWTTYRDAAGLFVRGATVRPASRIALVVGAWLTVVNQWDALWTGRLPWMRIAVNFLTPFVVASLGYLSARRRANVERLRLLLDDDRS